MHMKEASELCMRARATHHGYLELQRHQIYTIPGEPQCQATTTTLKEASRRQKGNDIESFTDQLPRLSGKPAESRKTHYESFTDERQRLSGKPAEYRKTHYEEMPLRNRCTILTMIS